MSTNMVLEEITPNKLRNNDNLLFDDDVYASESYALITGQGQRAKHCLGQVNCVREILQRKLTKDELDFTVQWSGRMISFTRLGLPLGITFALWKTYQTRSTFRFPFYSPNLEKLKPQEYFPHPRNPAYTGLNARLAWHILRASAYSVTSLMITVPATILYAMLVFPGLAANDPRGENIREAASKLDATLRLQSPSKTLTLPPLYPSPRKSLRGDKRTQIVK